MELDMFLTPMALIRCRVNGPVLGWITLPGRVTSIQQKVKGCPGSNWHQAPAVLLTLASMTMQTLSPCACVSLHCSCWSRTRPSCHLPIEVFSNPLSPSILWPSTQCQAEKAVISFVFPPGVSTVKEVDSSKFSLCSPKARSYINVTRSVGLLITMLNDWDICVEHRAWKQESQHQVYVEESHSWWTKAWG